MHMHIKEILTVISNSIVTDKSTDDPDGGGSPSCGTIISCEGNGRAPNTPSASMHSNTEYSPISVCVASMIAHRSFISWAECTWTPCDIGKEGLG